jgi:hypothetical protein
VVTPNDLALAEVPECRRFIKRRLPFTDLWFCDFNVLRPEFLTTDTGVPSSIPGHYKKKVVGLERGPLSLMSTNEELLDRKVAAHV